MLQWCACVYKKKRKEETIQVRSAKIPVRESAVPTFFLKKGQHRNPPIPKKNKHTLSHLSQPCGAAPLD